MDDREVLVALFDAAVAAVSGERAVRCALESAPDWIASPRVWWVLSVGKAAAEMAQGAHSVLGPRIGGGLVVTPPEVAVRTMPGPVAGGEIAGLDHRVGAHPLPDARSLAAGDAVRDLARRVPETAGLLVLLSGGASALCARPAGDLTLDHLRTLTGALLRAGVDIAAINTVRKHVSAIKGGQLQAASHAVRTLTLAISDVRGDDPSAIGSGPTVADPTTYADALAVCARVPGVPAAVVAHLERGTRGEIDETPKPGAACFANARFAIVASLERALSGADGAARNLGERTERLGPMLYGEAAALAPELVRACARARAAGATLVLAGGEPTVTVRGDGRGGRAQELALAFVLEARRRGLGRYTALFAGTDGRDGPTPAAGAYASPDVLGATGIARAEACLARNDSHTFFAQAAASFATAPTGTNVNDLALILLR